MLINHIAIWTRDLEKMRTFYSTYFGCTASAKYENKSKQFSSYFLSFSNGALIELMYRTDITTFKEEKTVGFDHISIAVGTREKVNSLTKKFENDCYEIDTYPRITGDGYYESVILDPENNRLELSAIEGYSISEVVYEDLEKLLYLQKCCYLSEAEIYDNYSIQPLRQTLEEVREDFKNQTFLKLEINNKIIGSVKAFEKDGTCYIGKLIVDPDYQNMGFGRELLLTIEEHFKKTKRFELFTGYKSEKNLHIYQKLGYRKFKNLEFDNVIMEYLEKINIY